MGVFVSPSVQDSLHNVIPDVDISALEDGFFAYESGPMIASPTDAAGVVSSRCIGVVIGVGPDKKLISTGTVDEAKFSSASSTPIIGKSVFLAKASDEPLMAAAGKLTADVSSIGGDQVVAEVGIVMDVDSGTFPITRTAKVVLGIKRFVRRAV
jgi:hypothetical protein